MHAARVAQWIRRRSPKPKIASSSLAVGKIFTHPAPQKYKCVSCGVRTHAPSREPELKSGALDHSAKLTIPMLVAGMEEIMFVRHAETRHLKCLLC